MEAHNYDERMWGLIYIGLGLSLFILYKYPEIGSEALFFGWFVTIYFNLIIYRSHINKSKKLEKELFAKSDKIFSRITVLFLGLIKITILGFYTTLLYGINDSFIFSFFLALPIFFELLYIADSFTSLY